MTTSAALVRGSTPPSLAELGKLEQLVLEAPEGPAPLGRAVEQVVRARIAYAFGEMHEVLIALVRGEAATTSRPAATQSPTNRLPVQPRSDAGSLIDVP